MKAVLYGKKMKKEKEQDKNIVSYFTSLYYRLVKVLSTMAFKVPD
jgi:hypothetical protein